MKVAATKYKALRLPLEPNPNREPKPGQSIPVDTISTSVFTTDQTSQPPVYEKVLSLLSRFGKPQQNQELNEINELAGTASLLKTPEDFRAQTKSFQERLAQGESLDSMRVEVYSVAREAAHKATGMRPYDSQVLGALAMGSGQIAEMMTGEGKTLAAVMPLYLNALKGQGAHLITVNGTLAQRDRQEMGPIFELLGLSVGTVLEDMTPEQKRNGYASDITYTTDRTIGFDYLRDRTAKDISERVQRPLFFALIDEVDEVLIDEARTPLIISGKGRPASLDYLKFDKIAKDLIPGLDYYVDRKENKAWLSETGVDFVENEMHFESLSQKNPLDIANYHRRRGAIRAHGKAVKELQLHHAKKPGLFSGLGPDWKEKEQELKNLASEKKKLKEATPSPPSLYSDENTSQIKILQASLKAHALFEEGIDYLVQDGKVKILDKNKGRTSKGRRYSDGLHQALEAKSGVPIQAEQRPIASITYPNLFKHYQKVVGMSGTAKSSEAELSKLYGIQVEAISTNLQFQLNPSDPLQAKRHNRIDGPDKIFPTKKAKFDNVVKEAIKAYEEGIPVLIGTISVEANEYVYARLRQAGVNEGALLLLNAEQVRGDKTIENEIIAQAGQSGTIAVATNMAGRGVNFKPDLTNFKKLAMTVEASTAKKEGPVVVEVRDQKEADKLSAWLNAYPDLAETVIQTPDAKAPADLKSSDYPTGGLYVIGTERAESRRIDDQLIGRSARQGKPGRSQFFLSLEDDLFLNSETHNTSKQVEQIQEEMSKKNLESRERTNKYDKALNVQREAFYALREQMVDPQTNIRSYLVEKTQDVVKETVLQSLGDGDSYSNQDVKDALSEINEDLHLTLDWPEQAHTTPQTLSQDLDYQVNKQVHRAFNTFDTMDIQINELYRKELLTISDKQWSEHLEVMRELQDGVQWRSVIGQKPEDAYAVEGYDVFESTIDAIENTTVAQNIPQIMTGARILKTERENQLSVTS